MFYQILINGLIAGAIYALVAAGFSLIYSTVKFVHFAHGGVIALSAYMLYFFYMMLGLNFWLAVILAIISGAIFGVAIDYFIYRQLRQRRASPTIILIASVAVLLLLESLNLIFFGADVKSIDFLAVGAGLSLGPVIITPLQIFIVITSLSLLAFLFAFMKYTKIGKAMRAVADNKDVAEIVGISAERVYTWSFALGSLIAGVAAVLIALEQNIEPTMGTSLMIKGFTASIIGGVESVAGGVLGAFLLGLAENLGIWWLPSSYKDAIAFVILFVFLLFRPEGILGVKKSSKL
ncbi:MAG TPA: branched-chain amino acid ABC transporter permease [Candidatus Paceibacterota bacterium]|nr:branched-chain amino acid ABC transporter permease [Candidatus Paceibacterota bacterium]